MHDYYYYYYFRILEVYLGTTYLVEDENFY